VERNTSEKYQQHEQSGIKIVLHLDKLLHEFPMIISNINVQSEAQEMARTYGTLFAEGH
jgi:hypothetical protein